MTTYFAPQTDLQFTCFKGISHTRYGESHKMPFAQWVQHRTAAAVTYWPSAAELSEELEQYRRGVAEADEYRDDLLACNEELWAKSVEAAKLTDIEAKALNVEVGAVLTDGRRTDAAVTVITWLFLDIDGIERDRLSPLVAKLRASGLCFYATESARSRLPLVDTTKTGPVKIHVYVPLQPIVLPAGVPTVEIKAWWCKTYAAAVDGLLSGVVDKYDTSVDDLAQPCFVAQVPPCGDRRFAAAVTDGNFLDLEAYVVSLGHTIPRPLPATAQGPKTPAVPVATATATASSTAPTPDTPRPVSAGPTPGETTGSLVFKAIKGLGLLGRILDSRIGKWSCRCPWAHNHGGDPLQTVLDSSTVVFEDGITDGGFDCKHNGCRSANGGVKRTAQDVLRKARLTGVQLPDRPSFAGIGEGERDAIEASISDDGQPEPAAARPRSADPRLRIVVQDDRLAMMRDASIAALRRRGDVFVTPAGRIVTLDRRGSRAAGRAHLAAVLSEEARFVRVSRDREGNTVDKPVAVPIDVVAAVLDMGDYPTLRPLKRVVHNPALLASGRVVTSPGYDAESTLYFVPPPGAVFSIPEAPTKADAEAAAKALLWYVRHTNFCESSGPSAWLALVLTLAARQAFTQSPTFGFDAAEAQIGKTNMIKIAYGVIYGGAAEQGRTLQKFPSTEDEIEKRFPLWAKHPLVAFDNMTTSLASGALDLAITAGSAGTRLLGSNDPDKADLLCDLSSVVFAYSGCNLAVGADQLSRTIVTRIKPSLTKKFDFDPDDATFYAAQRASAVSAALTLLKAFIVAGMPQTDGPHCRFTEWSRLVRGAIKWIGMPDPWGAAAVDQTAEARGEALHALAAWRVTVEGNPWGVWFAATLSTDRFKQSDESDESAEARRKAIDALSAVMDETGRRKVSSPADVGRTLHKLKDATVQTVTGSVRFDVEAPTSKSSRTRYRLVKV